MTKFATLLAAAAAFSLVSGAAMAGPVYLWGTNAKGQTAKAGGYSRTTRIYTPAEHARLGAAAKKRFGSKISLCEKDYMISTTQRRWIAAHRKAKHKVGLREQVGKGRYETRCDRI